MFNIVLTPHDKIATIAADFASAHFGDNHMDYCLGVDGHLPHISIARLPEVTDRQLTALFSELSNMHWPQGVSLEFGETYHIPKGYYGLKIVPLDQLQKMHEDVYAVAKKIGVEVDGACLDDYFPHFTFSKTHKNTADILIPSDLRGRAAGWSLELGRMGAHGVYLGRYSPV